MSTSLNIPPTTTPIGSTATSSLRRRRVLTATLRVTAAFQFALGAMFLVAPGMAPKVFDLPEAPVWTDWLFAMMAARFLGYGVGMLVAARDPQRNRTWINTMIAIQLVDWLATVGHLAAGDVGLRQVTSAAVVPLVLAGLLFLTRPRDADASAAEPGSSY